MLGLSYVNDLRRAILIQTTSAQIQTACALERFRLRNNRYPQNLSDVGTIPEDPITGAPQIYRVSTDATSYVLYSVGWDGRDNGGAPPNPWRPENRAYPSDWVWFSDHAAPKKLLNETAAPALQ